MSLNLSESQEDYLEAIYGEIEQKGGVRVKDIADRVGVKKPTVTSALKILKNEGLINYEPYGVISLTEAGNTIAKDVYETHGQLYVFFTKVFELSHEEADKTACRMEHLLDGELKDKFMKFTDYLLKKHKCIDSIANDFQEYLKTKS